MSGKSIQLFAVGLVAATLCAGAAQAQVQVSSTNDYALTWTGSAFGGASTLYGVEEAYDATAFDFGAYNLFLYSDAANLNLNNGGGVTINFPTTLTPPTPYNNPMLVVFSGNGNPGSWGATYNTAVPLALGTLGSLPTLTFTAYDSQDITGIGYYVYAYLPGDWTTAGTSPGDYTNVSVGAGFSPATFSFMGGVTTVETFNADYQGTGSNLIFTLIGSPVPEPSTWAMMLIGFAGLGFLGYRQAAKARVAA